MSQFIHKYYNEYNKKHKITMKNINNKENSKPIINTCKTSRIQYDTHLYDLKKNSQEKMIDTRNTLLLNDEAIIGRYKARFIIKALVDRNLTDYYFAIEYIRTLKSTYKSRLHVPPGLVYELLCHCRNYLNYDDNSSFINVDFNTRSHHDICFIFSCMNIIDDPDLLIRNCTKGNGFGIRHLLDLINTSHTFDVLLPETFYILYKHIDNWDYLYYDSNYLNFNAFPHWIQYLMIPPLYYLSNKSMLFIKLMKNNKMDGPFTYLDMKKIKLIILSFLISDRI